MRSLSFDSQPVRVLAAVGEGLQEVQLLVLLDEFVKQLVDLEAVVPCVVLWSFGLQVLGSLLFFRIAAWLSVVAMAGGGLNHAFQGRLLLSEAERPLLLNKRIVVGGGAGVLAVLPLAGGCIALFDLEFFRVARRLVDGNLVQVLLVDYQVYVIVDHHVKFLGWGLRPRILRVGGAWLLDLGGGLGGLVGPLENLLLRLVGGRGMLSALRGVGCGLRPRVLQIEDLRLCVDADIHLRFLGVLVLDEHPLTSGIIHLLLRHPILLQLLLVRLHLQHLLLIHLEILPRLVLHSLVLELEALLVELVMRARIVPGYLFALAARRVVRALALQEERLVFLQLDVVVEILVLVNLCRLRLDDLPAVLAEAVVRVASTAFAR